MNQSIRNPVRLNMTLDLIGVISEISEGVVDLGKREMRQVSRDFFGNMTEATHLDDCAHGSACGLDNGFTAQDRRIADNVRMFGDGSHSAQHHIVPVKECHGNWYWASSHILDIDLAWREGRSRMRDNVWHE